MPLLVLVISLFVYGLYGLDGRLFRDRAIFLYAGQQMAEGIPPYVSIFDHRGPLAYILPGLGILLSRLLGTDEIYTVRLIFFILGCLTVVAVYLLSHHLFGSPRVGLFSALTFLGFIPFARQADNGPTTKAAMLLFAILALLLTTKRKWFWAGFFGSLAALVWQPIAAFPFVNLLLAGLSPKEERKKAVGSAVLGALLPLLAIVLYFQSYGALYQLWEGSVLFNLLYLARPEASLLQRILKPMQVVLSGYSTSLYSIFIGLLTFLYIFIWRRRHYASFPQTLQEDRFAPLLITFPFPFVWALVDFQALPDFFPFLPYIAIGFGFFLESVLHRIGRGRALSLAVGIALFISAAIQGLNAGGSGLEYQREAAREIERRFGSNVSLVTLGDSRAMVLLGRENPNRYLFVRSGVDQLIQDTFPGGFGAWVQELAVYDPEVIVFGPTWGEYTPLLTEWLEENYHKERIGPWNLWVRNDLGESAPSPAKFLSLVV